MRRTLTTCLLGLAAAISLACALPAETDSEDAFGGGLDPVETEIAVAPWAPSEEWLELYERDQEIQDLRAAGEMEAYHEARRDFEDWIVQNPDADLPCETRWRYAPPEMRDAPCNEPELSLL